MYEKNLDHEILKLIEAQPEISCKNIAFNLSVPEELVKTRIEYLNDTRDKILVLSYGSSIYDSLKVVLESENYSIVYSIVKASEGSSALEAVNTEKPDLVLLDTGLLDTDGFEICRQLKASPRYWWIPVVVLSERAEVQDRIKAFESGADDYVIPPFSLLELKARIGMILRHKRV
jgi:two-component system, OmpR family, alkaline phosphatase synthesis response regulator PhoP